jgi:hypothetical protein
MSRDLKTESLRLFSDLGFEKLSGKNVAVLGSESITILVESDNHLRRVFTHSAPLFLFVSRLMLHLRRDSSLTKYVMQSGADSFDELVHTGNATWYLGQPAARGQVNVARFLRAFLDSDKTDLSEIYGYKNVSELYEWLTRQCMPPA